MVHRPPVGTAAPSWGSVRSERLVTLLMKQSPEDNSEALDTAVPEAGVKSEIPFKILRQSELSS